MRASALQKGAARAAKRQHDVSAFSIEDAVKTDSKLTARSQTTIPSKVRKALKLTPGDHITYNILPDGTVVIERAKPESEEEDKVMNAFLSFLAGDMETHPDRIKPFTDSMVQEAMDLVGNLDIDLDKPLKRG